MPPKRKPQRNLAAEVEQLRQQVSKLTTSLANPQRGRQRGGRSRSRSRSRSRGAGPRNMLPAAVGGAASSRMIAGAGGVGVIVIPGHEIVTTIKVNANSSTATGYIDCNPGAGNSGAELQAISTVFTQYRPRSIWYEYEPMCGTTTNGAIVMGLVPNSKASAPKTLSEVSVLQPNITGPLYVRQRLTVPQSFMREKNWYDITKDASEQQESPVVLAYWVDADSGSTTRTLGRIWAHYSYEFQGFKKP